MLALTKLQPRMRVASLLLLCSILRRNQAVSGQFDNNEFENNEVTVKRDDSNERLNEEVDEESELSGRSVRDDIMDELDDNDDENIVDTDREERSNGIDNIDKIEDEINEVNKRSNHMDDDYSSLLSNDEKEDLEETVHKTQKRSTIKGSIGKIGRTRKRATLDVLWKKMKLAKQEFLDKVETCGGKLNVIPFKRCKLCQMNCKGSRMCRLWRCKPICKREAHKFRSLECQLKRKHISDLSKALKKTWKRKYRNRKSRMWRAGYYRRRPYTKLGRGYYRRRPYSRRRSGYYRRRPYSRRRTGYYRRRPYSRRRTGYYRRRPYLRRRTGYYRRRPYSRRRTGYYRRRPYSRLGKHSRQRFRWRWLLSVNKISRWRWPLRVIKDRWLKLPSKVSISRNWRRLSKVRNSRIWRRPTKGNSKSRWKWSGYYATKLNDGRQAWKTWIGSSRRLSESRRFKARIKSNFGRVKSSSRKGSSRKASKYGKTGKERKPSASKNRNRRIGFGRKLWRSSSTIRKVKSRFGLRFLRLGSGRKNGKSRSRRPIYEWKLKNGSRKANTLKKLLKVRPKYYNRKTGTKRPYKNYVVKSKHRSFGRQPLKLKPGNGIKRLWKGKSNSGGRKSSFGKSVHRKAGKIFKHVKGWWRKLTRRRKSSRKKQKGRRS